MLSAVINGHERFFGNNEPFLSGDPKHINRVYGDFPNQKLYARSEWRPTDWSRYVPEILDQDGIGACNAFCTVMTVHIDRAKRQLPYRCLSAGHLYGKINGGTDQGSNLEDALREMNSKGTCYAETVGMLDWRSRNWPRQAAEEAKENLILEAYWCPTFAHAASAIMDGYTVNFGVWWYDNDDTDSNGWLPERPRGDRGGHSICGLGLAPKPGSSSVWGGRFVNSWGKRFGDGGFGVLPESRFTSDGMSAGMWAICASTVPVLPTDLPTLAQSVATEEHEHVEGKAQRPRQPRPRQQG